MIRLLFVCLLCLMPATAFAVERAKVAVPPTRALTMDCVMEAARKNNLPLAALLGILAAEGGKPGEALKNTNGTWDMGPYQVNTCHVNTLAAIGMTPETVLRDGCANAQAAAWILRREFKRTGDIWQAIGAYHSRTPHFRDAYIGRVKQHLARMWRTGVFGLPGNAQ
jgi:hypothetical protein